MPSDHHSVLLLSPPATDTHSIERLLYHLECPVAVTHSVSRAINVATTHRPCLLIIQGNAQQWSFNQLRRLRTIADKSRITLLALADSHLQSWLYQEDNPGFDGFLVNPVSHEILQSVLCSASARQLCR